MAKKKSPSRTTRTKAAKKVVKTKAKTVKSAAKKVKVSAKPKRSASRTAASAKKAARKPVRGRSQSVGASGAELLTQAEADITTVIEALNNQMNSALTALTELVSTQGQRDKKTVVHTLPLDRATSMFHRLVREVVDEQLAEMLPPLITLRSEILQHCQDKEPNGLPNTFSQRAQEILDNVLTTAGVEIYETRIGDPFDPLIHLAVGEANRQDLTNGVIAEQLQPGFRSTHGKVLAAAKVRINRR